MFSLVQDLKTNAVFFSPDFTDAELAAIGEITSQWAFLEHVIYAHCEKIAEAAGAELPSEVTSFSFTRRRRAWRIMIEELVLEPEKTRLLKLVSKVANAEQDRHKITHGIWEWDVEDPDKIKASCEREPFQFEKDFKVDALTTLAQRIGEVSASIMFPNGMTDFYSMFADENGFVSYAGIPRSLARDWKAAKSQNPPDDPRPKPQEE